MQPVCVLMPCLLLTPFSDRNMHTPLTVCVTAGSFHQQPQHGDLQAA